MIVSDTIEKDAKCCSVTSGESEDEIVEFMLWLKAHVRKKPRFFTIDLKPGMDAAILAVFPDVIIIICTFHAVKLLIGGLSRELSRLQRVNHGLFIKECKEARRLSLKIEKAKPTSDTTALNHDTCKKWLEFYKAVQEICTISDVVSFRSRYIAVLDAIKSWNEDIGMKYETLLSATLVNNEITKKIMPAFKKSIKTKWRAVLLDLRKETEEERTKFARVKHVLLKRPKNVMKWENKLMEEFFTINAWARGIRDVMVRFYELLDNPSGKEQSLSFLDALVSDGSHEKLKSAVETLKAKQEYVFNYLRAWKSKKAWNGIKSIKVNAEFINKHINNVFRIQFGFRSDESARYKLEQFLKCPVFFSRSLSRE
nr:transposase [Candidatus Sigynarchaeota archaeon]